MAIDVEARHVKSVGAVLGEGPVWIQRDSTLRFVDIKRHRVYRFDPASGDLSFAVAPEQSGFVLPVKGDGFIVGCKNGLYRFDEQSGQFTRLSQVEPHLPTNRLNDACVGPDQALWFGSMDDSESALSGALYRCDEAGRSTALDKDICITNGPAFSADGKTFYHTDTMNKVVHAFDHSNDGKLSNKRVFVTIEAGAGYPDGSAVDSAGCVWIALWGGWGVRRYSPQGELLTTVRFPVSNVTKIAFGGADRLTAYATSASKGLSDAERAKQPMAGDLFSFRVDAPGLPSYEVKMAG
jgi:sugar lactone lactonase YvrE